MDMSDNGITINSTKNPRIKALVHLRIKRHRDKTGLILIEGIKELALAVRRGIRIEEIYCSTGGFRHEGSMEGLIDLKGSGKPKLFEVSDRVFERISYRGGSSGVVAVAKKPELSLDGMPIRENPLYIVMDDVEKPGNLGAILRSADGAGAAGVITSDGKTDLYNPNVIRASLGTVFTVPTAAAAADEAIAWLKSRGIRIVVTTPAADTPYTEADLTGPTAIVVGSEDRGVGRDWLDAADIAVRIPMHGAADSLNVAQSATILAYEALRQRTAVGGR